MAIWCSSVQALPHHNLTNSNITNSTWLLALHLQTLHSPLATFFFLSKKHQNYNNNSYSSNTIKPTPSHSLKTIFAFLTWTVHDLSISKMSWAIPSSLSIIGKLKAHLFWQGITKQHQKHKLPSKSVSFQLPPFLKLLHVLNKFFNAEYHVVSLFENDYLSMKK